MFKFQKEKCTSETAGVVTKIKWNGDVWFLTAEYCVDGITYQKTEQLRYQRQTTYKLGKIPIGMKAKSPLASLKEGDPIKIKYNPHKPKKAYMPDNEGALFS